MNSRTPFFFIWCVVLDIALSLPMCAAASTAPADSNGAVHAAIHEKPRRDFIVRISAGNRITGTRFGHGICLDSPCVHVLTNYHVAGLIPGATVEGVEIQNVRFATGRNDDGAVPLIVMGGIARWNPQRDMALLTLKRPLPGNFRAAEFADYTPSAGTPVTRFPAAGEVYSGKLLHNGRVKYLDGTGVRQELNLMLLADFDSPPGVSGGALCDSEGRVLGLNEFAVGSMAIPTPVIADFLLVAAPDLWQKLHLQHVATVLDTPVGEIQTPGMPIVPLRFSVDADAAVTLMIEHANAMRLGMSRVLAKAEVLQSGPGVKREPKHFEVSLYDAGIRWRMLFPNGALGPEIPDFPLPQTGVIPGADWDYLLNGLHRSSVSYQGETIYNGDFVHVFSFQKMTCPWREMRSAGEWKGTVACRGKVTTDLDYCPISIQAEFDFDRDSIMSHLEMEIKFQRFQFVNGQRYDLPARVDVKAKYKRNFGTYRASNVLTNFRPFGSDHVIRTD